MTSTAKVERKTLMLNTSHEAGENPTPTPCLRGAARKLVELWGRPCFNAVCAAVMRDVLCDYFFPMPCKAAWSGPLGDEAAQVVALVAEATGCNTRDVAARQAAAQWVQAIMQLDGRKCTVPPGVLGPALPRALDRAACAALVLRALSMLAQYEPLHKGASNDPVVKLWRALGAAGFAGLLLRTWEAETVAEPGTVLFAMVCGPPELPLGFCLRPVHVEAIVRDVGGAGCPALVGALVVRTVCASVTASLVRDAREGILPCRGAPGAATCDALVDLLAGLVQVIALQPPTQHWELLEDLDAVLNGVCLVFSSVQEWVPPAVPAFPEAVPVFPLQRLETLLTGAGVAEWASGPAWRRFAEGVAWPVLRLVTACPGVGKPPDVGYMVIKVMVLIGDGEACVAAVDMIMDLLAHGSHDDLVEVAHWVLTFCRKRHVWVPELVAVAMDALCRYSLKRHTPNHLRLFLMIKSVARAIVPPSRPAGNRRPGEPAALTLPDVEAHVQVLGECMTRMNCSGHWQRRQQSLRRSQRGQCSQRRRFADREWARAPIDVYLEHAVVFQVAAALCSAAVHPEDVVAMVEDLCLVPAMDAHAMATLGPHYAFVSTTFRDLQASAAAAGPVKLWSCPRAAWCGTVARVALHALTGTRSKIHIVPGADRRLKKARGPSP